MQENITLIEYQDNFADNLSSYAYAKMIEAKTGQKCYFVNNPKLRDDFEKKMSCFNLNFSYISSLRAKEIAKKANEINRFYINKKPKNIIIKTNSFNINDIDYISKDIIDELNFKNTDFIFNHDILEEIANTNSIGLYISPNDYLSKNIDTAYIENAIKRLNKYLKHPKLFIFLNLNEKFDFKFDINYSQIKIDDYKEEFELLKSCKHKIILNTLNSYSEALWASLLNEKDYYLIAYDKKLKMKKKKRNWIEI